MFSSTNIPFFASFRFDAFFRFDGKAERDEELRSLGYVIVLQAPGMEQLVPSAALRQDLLSDLFFGK